MLRFLSGVIAFGMLAGCAPSDPRYEVKDDETLRCLKARGLTSEWELSRAYTASVGVSNSYVPNEVTSVRLAFASAHCMVNKQEGERLIGILLSSGYVDPT
jgi:hypothetical protein